MRPLRWILLLAAPLWACAPLTAGLILQPFRLPVPVPPAELEHVDVTFSSIDGFTLDGWYFPAEGRGPAPALAIYMHGHTQNRARGLRAVRELRARGLDVLVYDQRAHGTSDGNTCTYGYYEKFDLSRAVTRYARGRPVVVMGYSLGGATALQAAALDDRIRTVIAIASFSDLRTAIVERNHGLLSERALSDAIAHAEREGRFSVDAVSPVRAASEIRVPVLLVHGRGDDQTPPDHSRRIYDALAGEKRLVLISGGHNFLLGSSELWPEVHAWLDALDLADGRLKSSAATARRGPAATGPSRPPPRPR